MLSFRIIDILRILENVPAPLKSSGGDKRIKTSTSPAIVSIVVVQLRTQIA